MLSVTLNLLLRFNVFKTLIFAKKLFFVCFFILPLSVFSQETVEDKAFIKIENKLLFESEFNRFKRNFTLVNCLFGESIGKEFLSRNKVSKLDQLVFYLKLEKYITSIGFKVEKHSIDLLLKNRLSKCDVYELNKALINAIHSELYLQEYLLNFSKMNEKIKSFQRLYSLINKKFPHYLYE